MPRASTLDTLTIHRDSIAKRLMTRRITKAILLLTDGRVGPAPDSMVMNGLAIPRPTTADEWVAVLSAVSEALRGFVEKNGVRLESVESEMFAHLTPGRLYDMAPSPG